MSSSGRSSAVLRHAAAAILAVGLPFAMGTSQAQQASQPTTLHEIVVTGTQIRGAAISGALPVSVLSSDTLADFGIDSGDELLELIPENGNNTFNEASNISGGVNSARGDVGAFNLRSMGTGNTLVLLNGRRMVNAPQYQTEKVGGSFVPVNTVNANMLPVYGIERVEVLREGASAIYGADAVAGVFNTVLKKDLKGLTFGIRYADYEDISRNRATAYLEWGKYFNGGRTNVGVTASYYDRDRVNSQDDPRWANSDFRYRIPPDSPWAGSSAFNNGSTNSMFGQYDVVQSVSGMGLSGVFTDSSGRFQTYPAGDPKCDTSKGWPVALDPNVCGAQYNQGRYPYNLNANRDVLSALKRGNVFAYLNHQFESGVEAFTELNFYDSRTNLIRHPTSPFSAERLRVGAQNYYNPFGPCGSPNRLPADVIPDVPCTGLDLWITNIRFTEYPRFVDNNGRMYRLLQGFRGTTAGWDWESAITWNAATDNDITHNRVSNSLIQAALLDPTPAAFNPFAGGVNDNIEQALIDVYRKSRSELVMFDAKASKAKLFDLPAGSVGMVAGYEHRRESFADNRDPRLDGTITWTDWNGITYPYVSDVVNSSPTPDNHGARNVDSLFTEFSIPVLRNLDVQAAVRYEHFSDVGSATVGKFAFGWRPFEPLLIRGSWSQGFRVPNLVTVNESIVSRVNTGLTDYACLYAAENGGDPNQQVLDCVGSMQRIAQGSKDLKPEKSRNYSVGFVLTPIDQMSLSVDYWEIRKTNTIGLLGEENHTLVDLVKRLEAGTDNCANFVGDPAVVRDPTVAPDIAAIYQAAGICPAGAIAYINDRYQNLDTRTVRGIDVGLNYALRTSIGRFSLRYAGSFLEKYEQTAGGAAGDLVAAQQSGLLPPNYPVAGFANIIGQDGNQRDRMNLAIAWRKGPMGASLSGNRIGSFYQSSLTLADGTRYVIPAMTTYNATVDYTWDWSDNTVRARLGVNNFTNARAPLADDYFGYFSDAHSDLGRYYYLDVRFSLGGN